MSKQPPTQSELDLEYFRLKNNLRNLQICVGSVGFLIIGVIVSIFLHAQISSFLGIEKNYTLVIPVIQILVIIPLVFLTRKYMISSDERLFYRCYGLQKLLNNFLETKSKKSKRNTKFQASTLESYVDRWVVTTAPTCMLEISEKLSKHFDDLWWTLDDIELDPLKIKNIDKQNNNLESLKKFNLSLYDFCSSIYKNPPSFDVLSNFTLNAFNNIAEKHYQSNTFKVKYFYEKYPLSLIRFFKRHPTILLIIPLLTGIATALGLYYLEPTKVYDNLMNVIIVILMTFAVVVPIWLVLKGFKLNNK